MIEFKKELTVRVRDAIHTATGDDLELLKKVLEELRQFELPQVNTRNPGWLSTLRIVEENRSKKP